jgi:hypothetical protein
VVRDRRQLVAQRHDRVRAATQATDELQRQAPNSDE